MESGSEPTPTLRHSLHPLAGTYVRSTFIQSSSIRCPVMAVGYKLHIHRPGIAQTFCIRSPGTRGSSPFV